MVAGTDTTLDLHLLEGVGLLVLLGTGLLLGARLVSDNGSEDDVLAEGGGVAVRAGGALGFDAHLGPLLALCDAGLLVDALGDGPEALGALDFLSILVYVDGDDGLGAVLVLGALGCWEGGGKVWLIVLGPVGSSWGIRHGCWEKEVRRLSGRQSAGLGELGVFVYGRRRQDE